MAAKERYNNKIGKMTKRKRNIKKMAAKVLNDPIHGNIELHPLLVKIVDTPQFQRLRFIKQLGGVYFVYPGASHNRFEHSIGVCHLAGRFVRALQDENSKVLGVKITNKDELCVEIAALCHDLGHGPFSHLFDMKIIPKLWEKKRDKKEWTHEQGSADMLDYMLEDKKLKSMFKKEKIYAKDITFIKEMIVGTPKEERKGRRENKWFLYEIVSNKRNGIDVDKWDYFARDSHMLGIGNNFNHNRLISFSRVIKAKGAEGKKEQQICYRDKEATNLYDMFHIRNLLHQRAYQHKTSNSIEIMLSEALVLADKYITFKGKDGKNVRMSDIVNDMKAYTLLNDGVIHIILGSNKKGLEKSKEILNRIFRRDLYRFVGEKRFPGGTFGEKDVKRKRAVGKNIKKEDDVKRDIKETLAGNKKFQTFMSRIDDIHDDPVVIDIVELNFGSKDRDPITNVKFYSKNDPNNADSKDKKDVSLLLPEVFNEQSVRVYCKEDRYFKAVTEMFEEWAKSTPKSPKKQKTV
ncbi:deoxynucleoside triphosphate triphosphohydrolase SAMHD1-like isoform X1 [Ruditapes philippinarum]|uniref:deoxynucleoside triphosphate triphosphohydrolase SAMHD1-like isoform X1 n=1 Tax=Ruditapes philippinarum TaxID=129788 RepID=UPI00295BE12C|nr:deoxynucleoside triphosphate triphosphohydrolase SAMHD1-like isoform X1 [Ruditapes philippinarum]XP_060604042.1 deoxynucleoside triphosphate triphosphohydrolase SAMHD1-like isoform X1 [Ruditapes philippinarum]